MKDPSLEQVGISLFQMHSTNGLESSVKFFERIQSVLKTKNSVQVLKFYLKEFRRCNIVMIGQKHNVQISSININMLHSVEKNTMLQHASAIDPSSIITILFGF